MITNISRPGVLKYLSRISQHRISFSPISYNYISNFNSVFEDQRNYSKISTLSDRYNFNSKINYNNNNNSNSNSKVSKTIDKEKNIVNNLNALKLFSFNLQGIIQKADDLVLEANKQYLENTNSMDTEQSLELIRRALKLYIESLPMSKNKEEKGLIYYRISSCRFRLGLLSKAQEDIMHALSLLPLNHSESYKVVSLMATYLETEFDMMENKTTDIAKDTLKRAKEAWNKVIEFNSDKPDGYIGVGRCMTKSDDMNVEMDILRCFRFSDKALMCTGGKTHPPTLLFSSEMLLMQEKDNLSLLLLNNFFKNFKEFYTHSYIYQITTKDLADAYFRRGVCNYNFENFNEAIQDFSDSIKKFQILLDSSNSSKKSKEQVILYKNDLISSYYFRGKSYKFKGQYLKAIEDFNFVIQEKDQIEKFDESLKESLIQVYSERAESLRISGVNNKQALDDQRIFDKHRQEEKLKKEESVQMYIQGKREKLKKEQYLEKIGYYDEDIDDEVFERADYEDSQDK
ncbi:hypothetical protein DLAC_03804 [Tieghemostelium lacteum]|uniref:Uncharacterized protein n=1 Tax=Tieghemostelium lacteum TaxID=361077 RepID=A0A152A0S1_TIELA|nr:hypothetical protein DLAC_03804 [Tieghemostelium lacteum]|eukprot:KYQ99851.1 hypothetical protein DLAC_03804 [Tieghemostelium lacteum]